MCRMCETETDDNKKYCQKCLMKYRGTEICKMINKWFETHTTLSKDNMSFIEYSLNEIRD